MTEVSQVVLDLLGLSGDEPGDVQVLCPYHDDTAPSASFNVEKGTLNCFTCGRGWHHTQIEEDYSTATTEPEEDEDRDEPVADVGKLTKAARVFLQTRGFKKPTALGCRVGSSDDYLCFGTGEEGWQVARNLGEVDDSHPRYRNQHGKKALFWLDRPDDAERGVWLVEGVLDALALREVMPRAQVASALGASKMPDACAYELRGKTVFVAFDRDFAGFTGAKAAVEKLVEFEASPIVVELPKHLGKDFGDALQYHREEFVAWTRDRELEFATDDRVWVDSAFVHGVVKPMVTMPTGVPSWDAVLSGGLSEGVHAVGAETGAGKSSWAIRCAVINALEGRRGLYVTNEISRRQCWARVASCYDSHVWPEIEKDPTCVQKKTIPWLRKLAKNLRVVSGWDIGRITYAADDYDFIVVDYLQRMPGIHKGSAESAERQNIEHNITQLSNLGRDKGKVVIAIQRLRNSQGPQGIDGFYGSSAIRYVVQSGTVFKRVPGQSRTLIDVGKNTRGQTGVVAANTDLGHQVFIDDGEIISDGQGQEEYVAS